MNRKNHTMNNESFLKYLPLWRGDNCAASQRWNNKHERVCQLLRNLGLNEEAEQIASEYSRRVAAAYAYPK